MGLYSSRSSPNQPPPSKKSPASTPNRSRTHQPPGSRTRQSRAQPTAADVESYIQQLTELSAFLDGLNDLTSDDYASYKVAGEALDFDDETMNSYLEALSVKAEHLSGLRRLVDRHPTIARADLLRDLLENIEPKCRRMREKLSRLRSALVVEAPTKRRAERQASSETEEQPGPSHAALSGSAPVVAPTGPNQPVQSGSNWSSHVGLSVSLPVTRVSDLSESHISVDSTSSIDQRSSEDEESSEDEGSLDDEESQSEEEGHTDMKKLEEWRIETSIPNPKRIKIDRSNNLLDQAIPWYANAKPTTLRRTATVTFTGEKGMDMGALTREFFFIAFEAVVSGTFKGQKLLEGERGHLIPNAMTDPRAFTYLGRMIVHAVINECRGLPGLSPAIVHYLVSGINLTQLEVSHPPLHIDDVADSQLKQLLQKYENGEKFSESEEDAWMNWMTESNCSGNWRNSLNRQYVIQQLLLHYVFIKRIRQIQALEEGFKELGLRQFLVNNSTKENIFEVFPPDDSTAYSSKMVEAIINTRGDVFDFKTFDLFKQFMEDLHQGRIANFRLCDLIQYVTSSPYLPERLVVSFSPDITIPVAHACYNEITLPLAHQTYADFSAAMVTAFQNGLTGFQLQ